MFIAGRELRLLRILKIETLEGVSAYPDTHCYVKFYFGRLNQNTFDDRSK
jgi:hypothetical protein